MNAEELIKIQEAVGVAIEKHVNGKIRVMDARLTEYIKDDLEWKEQAAPTIELGNNIRGFGKVFAYILGTAGVMFGVFKGIVEFIRYFNK